MRKMPDPHDVWQDQRIQEATDRVLDGQIEDWCHTERMAKARRDRLLASDPDDTPIEWLLCSCTGAEGDTLCDLHREGKG